MRSSAIPVHLQWRQSEVVIVYPCIYIYIYTGHAFQFFNVYGHVMPCVIIPCMMKLVLFQLCKVTCNVGWIGWTFQPILEHETGWCKTNDENVHHLGFRLVVGPYPSEKYEWKSVGMEKMFQTTNQVCIFCILSDRLVVLPSVAWINYAIRI